MARLIVNPDTPQAWSLELPLGDYSLGRGEQNQVALEHPSVSSSHCTLRVSEEGLLLRDCGSTAGTWANGELVESVRLAPGGTFRVGEVELRFESDQPVAPVAPPGPVKGRPMRAAGMCHAHARVRARFFCPACNLEFCDFCVETRATGATSGKYCRRCGLACEPLALPAPTPAAGERTFAQVLAGTFAYPFRGSGVMLLVAGAVFFLLLGMLPFIGLLITGYLFSYAKRVVAASAVGEDAPPDWPDFTNWYDDVLVPYGHLLALVVLAFGPAWVLAMFLPQGTSWAGWLIILAVAAGVIIAPMGMLSLAMFDTVTALNPLALVWSILKIPGHYCVAAIAFGVVIGVYLATDVGLNAVFPVPFVGPLVAGVVNLYLLGVAMRILGLLYRFKKAELGWFNEGLAPMSR